MGGTRRDRQWGGPASPALCPQGPWATGTAGSPARSVGETGRQEAAARPGEARSEPEVETEDPAQTPPPGPCPPGAPGYRRPPPTPGPPRHHSAHPPRVPICKARAPRVLSLQSPCAPAPSPHLGKFGRKRSEPASEPPGQSRERPCPWACRGGSGPSCDAPGSAPTLIAPCQLPEGRSGSGAGSRPTRGEGWASLEPQPGAPPGNVGKASRSGAVRTGQNVHPSPRPAPACWGSHDPRGSRRGEGPTDTPPQSCWVYDGPLLRVQDPESRALAGSGTPMAVISRDPAPRGHPPAGLWGLRALAAGTGGGGPSSLLPAAAWA